jgi:hypothetical protein
MGHTKRPTEITRPAEDRRLVRLTKICLALPVATSEANGDRTGFKVRKKTFAYFLSIRPGRNRIVSEPRAMQTGPSVTGFGADSDFGSNLVARIRLWHQDGSLGEGLEQRGQGLH